MAKIKTGPKVKRKGGGIPAKSRAVDALAEQLRGSTAVIVTDYRGLKVGELQDLRKRLRPKGVEYHVVKKQPLHARRGQDGARSPRVASVRTDRRRPR
jgi:ribosomal protein L10